MAIDYPIAIFCYVFFRFFWNFFSSTKFHYYAQSKTATQVYLGSRFALKNYFGLFRNIEVWHNARL